MNRSLAVASSVFASLALGACSGGGGNPTPAPTATAAQTTPAGGTPTPKAGPGSAPSISRIDFTPAQTNELPNKTSNIIARAETSDPDGDGVSVSWRWFINGAEIIGEASDTLRAGRLKKGDLVEAEGTPRDTKNTTGAPLKASISVRNSTPTISSAPSGSLNGYKAIVQDADAGDPNERFTWALEPPVPPGFSITPDGTVKFDAAAGKGAQGQKVTVMVTDSRGAVAKQTFDVQF